MHACTCTMVVRAVKHAHMKAASNTGSGKSFLQRTLLVYLGFVLTNVSARGLLLASCTMHRFLLHMKQEQTCTLCMTSCHSRSLAVDAACHPRVFQLGTVSICPYQWQSCPYIFRAGVAHNCTISSIC